MFEIFLFIFLAGIIKKAKEKTPVLIQYIKDRVLNKNKSFFMIFVGPTGSGKSLAMVRLAQELDPTFTIDRVAFKPIEFMNIINDLVARSEKGEDIRGKVICWDELGASHSAREFMTVSNRLINYFFQTSRHLNLVVLVSVPLLSFIDSNTRKLSHGIGEMQGINSHDKTSTVKVKMMQVNALTGREYPKYLRFKKDSKTLVSKRIKFSLPSKDLLEAYEKKKKAFTTALNLEIMNKLVKADAKEKVTIDNPLKQLRRPLTPFQERILDCLKNGIKQQKDIAKKLGKLPQQISENIKFMRKKGIYIGVDGSLTPNNPTSTGETQF